MTEIDLLNFRIFSIFLSISMTGWFFLFVYFFHHEITQFNRHLSDVENRVAQNTTLLGNLYNEISLMP